MPQMQRFANKVVVVTGAAHGIGRGIAERFAGEGAAVVLVDRNATVMDTATDIGASGADVVGLTADVTSKDDVESVFAAVRERHGWVDVLVNNAGVITISKLEDLTLEDWNRV